MMPNEKTTKIALKWTPTGRRKKGRQKKHQVEDRGIGSHRITNARLKFEGENKY